MGWLGLANRHLSLSLGLYLAVCRKDWSEQRCARMEFAADTGKTLAPLTTCHS